MSTAAERIREARERDDARERENDENDEGENDENETPEPEPAAEPEQEPEQEPDASAPAAPPMSERDVEQGARKLENEAARHEKRVREIMGDDFAALLPCPACFTPGYVLPPGTTEYAPEQVAAMLALAGVEQGTELVQDPDTVPCERCGANGLLATGSRREGYTESACSKCGGQGWHARELPGQPPPPATPPYSGPPTFPGVTANGPGQPPQPFWDVASNSWKLP